MLTVCGLKHSTGEKTRLSFWGSLYGNIHWRSEMVTYRTSFMFEKALVAYKEMQGGEADLWSLSNTTSKTSKAEFE